VERVCEDDPSRPVNCPADMVAVDDTFCIDRYEASRPDATAVSAGTDESRAVSVAGVLPWQVESNAAAEAACRAADKVLCTAKTWERVCKGKEGRVYPYGDAYEPTVCNGIDTFGEGGHHLMPTGSFQDCTNEWGAFDMSGNLWEHTAHGDDSTVRGGAYNCIDSETLHRCDYIPGWVPSARGFRCCVYETEPIPEDGGAPDATADMGDDGGCVGDGPVVDWGPQPDGGPDGGSDGGPDGGPDAGADAGEPDALATGCPNDMVPIGGFCIDIYEASRSDATATSWGTSTTATTRPGALPWYSVTLDEARAGCQSMGKRLCQPAEWFEACNGTGDLAYVYGDTYDPTTCNGIDAFCNCSTPECVDLTTCPYPHCYNQESPEGGGPCGASFHVMPTGSFPDCTNTYGAFDVNGNVWEIVDSTDGLEHFRGGAYNCGDSEALHRCDYDATWSPAARGFRCCMDRS